MKYRARIANEIEEKETNCPFVVINNHDNNNVIAYCKDSAYAVIIEMTLNRLSQECYKTNTN